MVTTMQWMKLIPVWNKSGATSGREPGKVVLIPSIYNDALIELGTQHKKDMIPSIPAKMTGLFSMHKKKRGGAAQILSGDKQEVMRSDTHPNARIISSTSTVIVL